MQLVLLPGNSIHNKSWIYEVENSLKPLFESTYVHEYNHWKKQDTFINMPEELQKLLIHLKKVKDEYSIFAKSIGIIVALQGLIKENLKPASCMFVGNPSQWESRLGITRNDVNIHMTMPILFIQQQKDPLMSFKNVEEMVKKLHIPKQFLQEVPGHNHHYEDVTHIKQIIENFLSENNFISK